MVYAGEKPSTTITSHYKPVVVKPFASAWTRYAFNDDDKKAAVSI